MIDLCYKAGIIGTDSRNLTPEKAEQKANMVRTLYKALEKAPEEMTEAELDIVIDYFRQRINNKIWSLEKTM